MTKESKRTPGPWNFDGKLRGPEGQVIERGWIDEEEYENDMRLCAAAPDLLEALEIAYRYVSPERIPIDDFDRVRAAIKKARREES